MRIIVKGKDGCFYDCQNTPRGFRCGKCHRGVINKSMGSKCRICGSKVAQIIQDGEYVIEVAHVVPNNRKIIFDTLLSYPPDHPFWKNKWGFTRPVFTCDSYCQAAYCNTRIYLFVI